MKPIAYLRKSKVTSDRHISWEVQEKAIVELAAKHGDNNIAILSDWSRSGRGEYTHRRSGYLQLRKRIGAGEVSTLYAYSLSRLARSLSEYASLADLCQKHNVKVRLAKEGEQDFSTASGRFIVGILALLAQMQAELDAERAMDNVAHRRERGDYLGTPPYGMKVEGGQLVPNPDEDVDAIVEAYQRAGSFNGAARLLSTDARMKRRAPPRRIRQDGTEPFWSDQTVARILRRDGRLALPKTVPGSKPRASHLLYRLLKCPHCGTLLTGQRKHNGNSTMYVCNRGMRDPFHAKPYAVAESKVIDWVKDEAALVQQPDEPIRLAEANADRRRELQVKIERLGWAVADGLLSREQAQERKNEIEQEMAKLDEVEQIVHMPAINWEWATDDLNAILRTLWVHIVLNEEMRPLRAEWRIPEWRASDDGPSQQPAAPG